MSSPASWKIHIDGAARGNPGPAAYAFIIQKEGAPALEEKGTLGTMTNNLAEYTALVRALERARELGAERLIVHSDSELLVKQMNGEYRVKNPDLRVLYDRARELGGQFKQVVIRHVPREQNSGADRLCNEALDGAKKSTVTDRAPRAAHKKRGDTGGLQQRVRADVLECLADAAAAWAESRDPRLPPVEAVWEQLWSILEENGVLRPARSR